MKSTASFLIVTVLSPLFIATAGWASQGHTIQLLCESKAKEVAQSTYAQCIQQNRTAELEKIKREYQSKTSQLKSYYEKKIKALSLKKRNHEAQENAAVTAPPATTENIEPDENFSGESDSQKISDRVEKTRSFENELEKEKIKAEPMNTRESRLEKENEVETEESGNPDFN